MPSLVSGLSLAEQLAAEIKQQGPISFHDWMWRSLYDPVLGYYIRGDRERWGSDGDYRTSPHRSEIFAATFARYFAKLHRSLGAPMSWTIAEAGAGDGTFAAGVLSTLRDKFPQVFAATKYLVDEISDDSKHRLNQRLTDFTERVSVESLAMTPPIEVGIVFANELLDAFPVHLVTRVEGRLSEVYVGLDQDEQFVAIESSLSTKDLEQYCNANRLQPAEGQIIEVNLESEKWIARVARILRKGWLITVDYGAEAEELSSRKKGTLRAFAKQRFVDDFLPIPGECDLTTTVNWTRIREVSTALGFHTVDFLSQDRFLLQEGALVELQTRLDRTHSEGERLQLTTAARDLILPGGMSSSFQVLVQRRHQDYGKQ